MWTRVSLKEVADTLELLSQQSEAFLVRETGEILVVDEGDQFALSMEDPVDIPEWQREHIAKLRQFLDTDQVLRLPTSYDIHMWSIMEGFCHTVSKPQAREQLIDATHGKGAFRMFYATCERFRLSEEWYAYRRSTIEDIARKWLASNEIPYE